MPVFEEFCLMKVYKHLSVRSSSVDFSDNCNSLAVFILEDALSIQADNASLVLCV